jgi:DNA-binding NtrC family response regulator
MSVSTWVEQYLTRPSRLLVLDGGGGLGTAIKNALADYECEFTIVRNSEKALEAIAFTKFDLVFMDIVQLGRKGIELLKEIKQISHDTPVVLMSSYVDGELLEEASKVGLVSFIKRPVDTLPIKEAFQLFKVRSVLSATTS